jgi:hypothetical protein
MATLSFSIGQTFKHYNGYIWTITGITGKWITLVSDGHTEGSVITGGMTAKDLNAVINAKYYTLCN